MQGCDDNCFSSSDRYFVVVALYIARVESNVARGKVEPYPEDVIKRCGGILERLLIASNGAGDVNGRDDGVFDIGQELLLSVQPRPRFENI